MRLFQATAIALVALAAGTYAKGVTGNGVSPAVDVAVEDVIREEGDQVHFDGYTVYRLLPQERSQLQYIASLETEQDAPYDFWTHPSDVGQYVDINVAPSKKRSFEQEIEKRNISSAVLIEDLEQEIRNVTSQGPSPDDPTDRNQQSFFLDYRSYGEMGKHLDQLVYKYNSKEKGLLVKKHKIGLSSEKRDLHVLEVRIPRIQILSKVSSTRKRSQRVPPTASRGRRQF